VIELSVMPASGREPAELQHDVRASLNWRDWDSGLEEARSVSKPILCLAEQPWSNSAQRLALFLKEDQELQDLAAAEFIPVLVDPDRHPALAERILVAASQLEGTFSPPLLASLSEEGLPLVTYCNIAFEGDGRRPSLLALLRSTRDFYEAQRQECIVEARGLQQIAADHTAPGHNLFLPVWSLSRQTDPAMIDGLIGAGTTDQLDLTFHRAARMPGWGVPHFEKTALQNAAMANVLRNSDHPAAGEHARAAAAASFAPSGGQGRATPHDRGAAALRDW